MSILRVCEESNQYYFSHKEHKESQRNTKKDERLKKIW